MMINEKRLIDPISTSALSLTFKVHTPLAFWPSNAESGLSGAKFPESVCPDVEVTVDNAGNAPSSSSKVLHIFSRVPPRRFTITTDVALGDVNVKIRSPINV